MILSFNLTFEEGGPGFNWVDVWINSGLDYYVRLDEATDDAILQ